MPTEQFAITTPAGHRLSGALEVPTGLVRGAALFAHCFTCTKQSKAAVEVARALARQGIATLRFDFTGLGASEGEFGRAGFSSDIEDLMASAEALSARFGDGILLVGHSLGGAAVLAAAGLLPKGKVSALATIGAPSDVPHVLHNVKGDLEAIERNGEGDVTIGGRAFTLSREFIDKTRGVALLDQVAALRIPLLICHSPTDQIVGVEHASALFGASKHPKSFVSLAGADHLLTSAEDARFAANMIAGWAGRYLPMKSDWPMPEEGIIARTGHGKFGTEVHTRGHRFLADEPRFIGGDATGPSPYDLLGAALGTCTAMTMKMYAARKSLPFEGVSVHVTHERNHAEDLTHPLADGIAIQALHRRIRIEGDKLSDDDRAKLLEIADKCPVHRTLEGHLHIHTILDT
jgi:putative redox protein